MASLLLAITASAQVQLSFDTANRSHNIGENHYGIFFEEINHAGDGGLYAELIANRSFEDNDNTTPNWILRGDGTAELIHENLLNAVQRNALNVTINNSGATLKNEGFWGMKFESGKTYKLSFWVKSATGYNHSMDFTLCNDEGESVGTYSFNSTLSNEWKKYEAEITATGDAAKGSLCIQFNGAGEVQLDMVSLFPPTFKNRPNGCREDLAQMLADMKPRFMRFPGGCYIEGEYRGDKPYFDGITWTWGSTNRFQWKQTIGALEERPGHWNINWNYRVSDGLGFHEMLQLSEDIGAKPLFVVNMGMGHGWMEDYQNIDEYIQEALDALEYCNGDVSTTYGKMRAENGHPEPFNLKLIEIGNENYNFTSYDNRDQSDHYAERYIQFYNAIKAKYPDCVCIGNVEAWGTDNPSWRNEHPVDAVDEHYYRNPSWFVNQYEKYNAYDRTKMKKVYAGEYAVTSDFGTHGNLNAALGEAVYMQGMENNSDICIMNSYAPIFVNENDQKWMPDMIRFNSSEAYGTPSYYVQKLMSNYVGKQNIKWNERDNDMDANKVRRAGLSTWSTSAEFKNFKITRGDGTVYTAKFDGTENWSNGGGMWMEYEGTLSQSSTSMQGKFYMNLDEALDDNYTIEVDATKTGGAEGFLIAFNYVNTQDYCWWNIGGWNNTKHAVEVSNGGSKRNVAEKSGYLVTGQTYHIKITVQDGIVNCYMDGDLYHTFTLPAYEKKRKVYVSGSIDDDAKKLYIKIVNPREDNQPTTIALKSSMADKVKLIQMKSASGFDQNTNANHFNVVPTEELLFCNGKEIELNVPAYSFNILEIDVTPAAESKEVEEGIAYLYDVNNKAFLSRGADWGTRATIDPYGVPVNIIKDSDGEYKIKYADQSAKWFGSTRNDQQPYTDLDNSHQNIWNFVPVTYNSYKLYNAESGLWITKRDADNGLALSGDESAALEFRIIGTQEYAMLTRNEANKPEDCDSWRNIDVTDLLVNASLDNRFEGWETSFTGNGMNYRNGSGLVEVYQGYGRASQTLTGLKPGWYKFSLPAFFRGMTNDGCSALDADNYMLGNAYIYANDEKVRVMPWAEDRATDNYPNSMADAKALMDAGKYANEIYAKVGEDGKLNLGISIPQWVGSQWFICGPSTLTYLVEPVNYTGKIANPSFEYGMTGWTNSGMQTQGNNEGKAMKDGTYYCEKWVISPNALTNSYISQIVTNLPAGDYELSAVAHAEQQGQTLDIVGVTLFAGESSVSVSMAKRYVVSFTHPGGELTIGFKVANTNANWVTVDNFKLELIGEAGISEYSVLLDKAIKKLEDLLEEKEILPDYMKSDAVNVINAAKQAQGDSELIAALENVNAEYDKCKAYRIPVERDEDYKRYLFAYFPNNSDENLYYAVSEDAINYSVLNEGQRIMWSDTLSVKKGIRDPHLIRGVDGKTYYMVATDMKSAEGWASNRGIVMYKSADLVHWTHHTVHFPDRFPEWKNVTRVWAPATVWDPEYQNTDGTKGRYMIYYSLLTNDGKCTYDKVFYSYANDDFSGLLTDPVYLYDRGSATIDADIVYDESDLLYHMVYKNEGAGGICSVTAKHLTAAPGEPLGSQWSKPSPQLQQTNVAVEGGGLFRLINQNTWVLMYDCYGSGRYEFCTTSDWEKFTKIGETTPYGVFTPRHGSVLPITAEEYNAVLKAYPSAGLEEIPTGINEVQSANAPQHTKQIERGKVVINSNGKKYDILGVEIK